MKNLKIIIIASTIAILAIATLGVALAHNYATNPYYGGMTGHSIPYEDKEWWKEMEEHMRYRWGNVVDEELFNEMKTYMEEHFEEVKNQELYEEMTQFMEDRWESQEYGYRYSDFPRSYGRGCWSW